jgi:AcrR family transcriptional regulator
MQRPDDEKRRAILRAAARLFASRPFHEVRLEEVAAGAKVGKGTLYVYFDSKDELYATMVNEGFAGLLERVRGAASDESAAADQTLATLVREVVTWACTSRVLATMRSGAPTSVMQTVGAGREELGRILESVIRRGIAQGRFVDVRPDLTGHFILGAVRGTAVWGPRGVEPGEVIDHIQRVIIGGILRRSSEESAA